MCAFHLDSKVIHAGEPDPRIDGAISMPVFHTAMYETTGGVGYHDIRYIRLNNSPNHIALQAKLAALEGGEDAIVTASGMAAISTALLSVLSHGDHILAQDCLYGGTLDFITQDLPKLGIEYDLVDGNDPKSWKSKRRPNTQVIYMEAITNPLLQVADHRAVVEYAQDEGLISMIDSTFATPVNFRPLQLGYDLVLHSATKYLNGHSDLVAGVAIGGRSMIKTIRQKLNHLGGCMDPNVCFLLHRGVKTLGLRVQRQNENSLKLAALLNEHDEVETVYHPGLSEHPEHDRAAELFDGFGGMVSFELKGGLQAAETLLGNVNLAIPTVSLGGVETLICLPARTSHAGMTSQQRQDAGIADGLMRVSVGVEDAGDILDDFKQALDGLQ